MVKDGHKGGRFRIAFAFAFDTAQPIIWSLLRQMPVGEAETITSARQEPAFDSVSVSEIWVIPP